MTDFFFRISPHIIMSSYGTARLGEYAKERGSKYIIITDRILKEVSIYDKIIQSLDDRRLEYFIFDEFAEGATSQTIERILVLARQGHIHGVIAVGGAKIIHAGQVVAALYNESKELYDFIDGATPTVEPLPLICVPTTPREVFMYTHYAPVTDSRSNKVQMMNLNQTICSLVLIDPVLMSTLTENQKMTMAMESVCLASEAYLSQRASFFSDMIAEKALELLGYGLDGTSTRDVASQSEDFIIQGGALASLASAITLPGVCSTLAMATNIRFGISSSLTVSILFPHFLEEAGKYKVNRIEKLAHLFRAAENDVTGMEAVTSFVENMRMRLAKMNLPSRLKDLNVTLDQLSLATEDAGQLPLMSSLSRSMTTDDLFELLKSAY